MQTLTLPRPRGFTLDAASSFYCGFVPARGSTSARQGQLTLSFRLDGTFDPVVATLRDAADGIAVDYAGTTDAGVLTKQLSRIFGLEGDAEAWWAVGQRDPIIGRLQALFPGFFTATKTSPYDAAAWGVIAPRLPMPVAAALKQRIAKEHGDRIELGGEAHHIFPSPRDLLALPSIEGLSEEKRVRLQGVARAALEGKLEAERLRNMSELEALADLQSLRGIGPWSASHILYRGAAPQDALPSAEPRVLHGFAEAYGTAVPTFEAFAHHAEAWRPFRMWVCVLLSRTLARTGGWNNAGLRKERATAGKALERKVRHRTAPTPQRGARAS